MGLRFFIDFDGTITKTDVVDLILERFADPRWKVIEQAWIEGRIGSRECLKQQIDLVSAAPQAFWQMVKDVEVDPYFERFLKTARGLSIPVTIVSDGFHEVIQEILKHAFNGDFGLAQEAHVFSNTLEWSGGKWIAGFPEGRLCDHACANCKEAVIQKLSSAEDYVIFVGDGLSDRFAARVSDLTFAKGKLLTFCKNEKIRHKPFESFKDIEAWVLEHRPVVNKK